MNITFGPRGVLMIDDARIIFRNFTGVGSMYNREGDRNFALVIPTEEQADALVAEGWNVRVKDPVEEGDTPRMHLPVKVKYTDKGGPKVFLNSGGKHVELTEETISCLDNIDIMSVNMDIRPFDWEVSGKSGRSAYLQSLEVFQNIDRFSAKYAEEERYRD